MSDCGGDEPYAVGEESDFEESGSEFEPEEEDDEEEEIVAEACYEDDDDEIIDEGSIEESGSEEESLEDGENVGDALSIASEVLSLVSDVEEAFSSDSDDTSRSSDSDSESSRDVPRAPKAKSSPRSKTKSSPRSVMTDDFGFDSDSDDGFGGGKKFSAAAKRGCDYIDDPIVAEIIDEVRNEEPEKWCRLFEGSCFTNAGQLGHSNLPPCILNFDATTATVPSMYVKDIRASNDLKLQAQTTEGTFRLPSISMSRRKFHTKPIDLTPLTKGWRSTKIGNRYFMSKDTGAETGTFALAQVVNIDRAGELVMPRTLLERFRDFVVHLNWKRGYGVFEVSRIGEDWFAVTNIQLLGREEGGHAIFETSEKSQSVLVLRRGGKRYKDEYESARELGVRGSGRMISEYEGETIREPIGAKDYIPTTWPNGEFPDLVDEPRLEIPGLEICRTAHANTSVLQYEEKPVTLMIPRPLHGVTFDLHSKKLHKEHLSCIGLFKANGGYLVDDGYRSALSTLGASRLDIVVPEYFRVGDKEMEDTLKEVLCDDEKDRDALALRCVKTNKQHLEQRSVIPGGGLLKKSEVFIPGQSLIKKAGSATVKAGVATADVVANVAVGSAYDRGIVIDRSTKKKKQSRAVEAYDDGAVVRGRTAAFPVYEVHPLLRVAKRWYNPYTLKQEYLKDHRIPRKLRYVDIRLQVQRPKKSKKERKKRPTKSKNIIKERDDPSIMPSVATRDGGSSRKKREVLDGDGNRTVVSRKTTEFADGTIKKEIFFSDGSKATEVMESFSKTSKAPRKSTSIPSSVPARHDSNDDAITALTEQSSTSSKRSKTKSIKSSSNNEPYVKQSSSSAKKASSAASVRSSAKSSATRRSTKTSSSAQQRSTKTSSSRKSTKSRSKSTSQEKEYMC